MQIEMIVQRAARTFSFDVKSPPTSWLLLRCAGVEKGANQPGKETVGKPVSLKHVYEIAKIKQKVLNSWSELILGSFIEGIAFTVYRCYDNTPGKEYWSGNCSVTMNTLDAITITRFPSL